MPPSHTTRLQAHLTTQLRPHQPPHTEPLQPARKKLHTCQARTPASQKKLARHSSQPARHFRHARKKLFTARKGLRPARGTTPDNQQETPACRVDTRWDSHFATQIFHRLTPHTVSHLTPHTLHCPKFTDPPHTAPYLTSHTSHLTMTASLKELSPTRQDSNQPGRDFNQPGRDSSQPGRTKKLQQTVQKCEPARKTQGCSQDARQASFFWLTSHLAPVS